MSRPLLTFLGVLGAWLLGACKQEPAPVVLPEAEKPVQVASLHYFGRPADGKLHVYFLDVDQGDATLIVSPTGRTVLVDAGPPSAGIHLANRLPELLTGKLDLVILTHPHLDHYGGLSAALSAVGALQLLEPQLPGTSSDYDALMGAVGASGMEVFSPAPPANGEPLRLPLGGGAELTVLWPRSPTERLLTGDSPQELNSIFMRLSYGDTSVLLPGDALEKTEHFLVDRQAPLHSTLLKVGAHGAATASSAEFLAAVRPRAAVVSTGAGNPESAPSRQVLGRLEAMKTSLYRTDRDGEVLAVSDGQRFTLTTQRHALGNEPGEDAVFDGKDDLAAEEIADAGKPVPDAGTPRANKPDAGGVASRPEGAQAARPAAPPASTPAPAAKGVVRYVGSRPRHVYHRPDCVNVQHILPENLITFSTKEQASEGGRRPAMDCNPQ